MAIVTPLLLAAAVSAAGPTQHAYSPSAAPVRDTDVTPLAAVAPTPSDMSGPTVVTINRPPRSFHIAEATLSAPPPKIVVTSPGALRIPAMALSAYRNAEAMMARAYPACGVSWNLLAGIGRIESQHANGGATDAHGNPVNPIYGPSLDGSLPGNEIIVAGSQAGRTTYVRAMGPMQFLPGTWSRYASDGDGDGKADPQNLYDSALAAARYLCSGGLNLRDPIQVQTAILRYNNSVAYARNVLGWAAAYATGVAPVNLPAINGPTPPMGDAHLDHPEGLGPGLPMTTDADQLMFSLNQTDVANQLPVPPGPAGAGVPATAPCTIFCISENTAPTPAAVEPTEAGLPGFPGLPGLPAAVPAAPDPAPPAGLLPAPPPPLGLFSPPAPEPAPAEAAPPTPMGPPPGPAA
jgi:membrane-bound lytic murein transglycosylase B